MVYSLWTAAGGMSGQQLNIDSIANNLSNVNTIGYKKSRTDFQDLFYQTYKTAGTRSDLNSTYPVGIQVGGGSKPSSTQVLFAQGNLQKTGVKSDLCINGEGFFRVKMQDGSIAYTRDGSFKIDSEGYLVNSNGYYLDPPIQFDDDFIKESIKIMQNGDVYYKSSSMEKDDEFYLAGRILLTRFVNPAGLSRVGKNLYKQTSGSGNSFDGIASTLGYGSIQQGFLEMSNVQIVEELVSMIVAQRAYEFNSKAIQTTDSMLMTAVNIKR
uniref:Flagellar basal-body rod protein FlgG n=1 Tax=uncultured spirochete TaxID=156406 RepID=A0A224AT12_9SPIR|nr:flagellar basal-body rod protein [uncultured spirochete]